MIETNWTIKNIKTNEYYCSSYNGLMFDTIKHCQMCYNKETAENIIKKHKMKNCVPVKIKIIYEEIKKRGKYVRL